MGDEIREFGGNRNEPLKERMNSGGKGGHGEER